MGPEGFQILVERAQSGDRSAMDRVLDILHPHLEALARPYADPARPAESASDLLQESCLRAWQKLSSFEGGQDDDETFRMFRSWIGMIVKRQGLNWRRNQQRKRRQPERKILPIGVSRPGETTRGGGVIDPAAPDKSPSSLVRGIESKQRIHEILDGLPERDAEIVRLHFFEGLMFSEISERLGVGYHQVRDRYIALMDRFARDLSDR